MRQLTSEHEAQIRSRLALATPGDWMNGSFTTEQGEDILDHEGCGVWPWARAQDMEFAYSASEDMRALLSEIDYLRGLVRGD